MDAGLVLGRRWLLIRMATVNNQVRVAHFFHQLTSLFLRPIRPRCAGEEARGPGRCPELERVSSFAPRVSPPPRLNRCRAGCNEITIGWCNT
jgi:hypothetical protein